MTVGRHCTNCKHHIDGYWNQECRKFSKEETRWEPVQGPYKYRNAVTCDDARSLNGLCGVQGKSFEASRWATLKDKFRWVYLLAPVAGLIVGHILARVFA
ncbi:endolysin [Ralstonia phage RpY2]|uniref:Endolysin n=1 Tax=Ralstonia phage RpY2 TaxID=2880950 RepID=A0AC61TNK9_9CAUD|nr:endolysin [Ralstonia phage RpY2]WAX26368.1 hypothetical protein [Ralstonia phage p2137]